MSTPEIIGPVILCQTPAELAMLSVAPFLSGQHAHVVAMRTGGGPAEYVLQAAVSAAPDSFFIVPTADDAARQWVHASIQEQGALGFISPEFDLTAVQTLTLLPPIAYTFTFTQGFQLVITAKDGTVTTGPTTQAGTNSSVDNLYSSTVQNIAPTVLNGAANLSTAVAASNNLDLSTNGIRLRITSGAVLGTATVFKARLRFLLAFNRY